MPDPLHTRWFMAWQAGAWRRRCSGTNLRLGSLLQLKTILVELPQETWTQRRGRGDQEGLGLVSGWYQPDHRLLKKSDL